MRTTFKNCSNVAATKFRPRFRADTLTFLLSLWKLRASGIRIYFENESTSSCALEKHTWYRATRCGVNPKSNRSAVKFRARARYMQSGTSRTWKTDVEEATRNEQDECGRKKKKQIGKLTGSKGTGEAEIQNGRFQEEKDINAADYNTPRDATKIVPSKTPRSQSVYYAGWKFHLHTARKRSGGGGAEKKDADAICKTPVGEGRAMVIEEVEEAERRWQKSKSREGKFRYCLRQPRGTQRL